MNIVPHKTYRDQQIAGLIHQELQEIFEEAGNPRLNRLKVLSVIPKPGGRHFSIFVGSLDNPADPQNPSPEEREIKKTLEHAFNYIRMELVLGLNLKHCPDLKFIPMLAVDTTHSMMCME